MATVNPSTSSTPQELKGYNILACLMAQCPDTAIYRRFMSAHHFDLMLQQAELNYLLLGSAGIKLRNIRSSNVDENGFDTYFLKLIKSKGRGVLAREWDKHMDVRLKLKEYSDHLLQVKSLLRLSPANKDDIKTLRDWLDHPEGGARFLYETEDEIWAEETDGDLTSLSGHGDDQDALSKWLEGGALTWLSSKILHKVKSQYVTVSDPFFDDDMRHAKTWMGVYSDKVIRMIASIVTVSLAALLPATSIFALFFVERQLVRLGLILVYTMFFSAMMMLVTPAKKSECFAASAAFAAVLVVFVGNGLSNATVSGGSK